MYSKFVIQVIITSLLIGCNFGNEGTSNGKSSDGEKHSYENHIALKIMEDSIQREKEKQLEIEMQSLKAQGIFGKWECTFTGYESIIMIQKDGDSYKSIIDFINNNSSTEHEVLIKKGNKYLVRNSPAKEYYIIKNDRNLEMWDKDGLFTTARNIMPGMDSKPLPEFDINNVVGKNIFTLAGNYSKSSPVTLDGTNNAYWIVYYEDIDITFKVEKSIDRIQKAKEGKTPNLQ